MNINAQIIINANIQQYIYIDNYSIEYKYVNKYIYIYMNMSVKKWFSPRMMYLFPCFQLESQTNDMGAIHTYGNVKILSQNDGLEKPFKYGHFWCLYVKSYTGGYGF